MPHSRSDLGYMLVSIALAVGSGLGSAEPHKQVGVWFFGLCASVFLVLPWVRRSRNVAAKERVEFDQLEIRRWLPDGSKESIRWDELHEIGVVTTDQGPWADDVFWMFSNADQSKGCAVSNGAEGFAALLQRIQQLPDFNNEAVVLAMGSAVNDKFVVWRLQSPATTSEPRPDGAGSPASNYKMHPKHAKTEFECALAAAGRQLSRLRPSEGIRLMLNFYRTVRAEGCDMERDGDMLLFQYGTCDRQGMKQFALDLTRQLILQGGEDEDIWQLRLRFEFVASPGWESIGAGDRWCASLSDVENFEKFIATHAATLAVNDRTDGRVRLTYECVG